jgi:hypothetical protein
MYKDPIKEIFPKWRYPPRDPLGEIFYPLRGIYISVD